MVPRLMPAVRQALNVRWRMLGRRRDPGSGLGVDICDADFERSDSNSVPVCARSSACESSGAAYAAE